MSFQVALAVVFVVMVVAMIGHLLVGWITGGEHAMTRLVWMAGVWTVIWAIRRTVNREEPTPALAAGGTVVLPPRPRLPYVKDAMMLAGLLAVVIGSHYLTVRVLHPLFGRVPPGPTVGQVAQAGMGHDWATVPLAQGGTIELMAVSEVGRAVNRWWSPSGEPLARRLDTQQDSSFGGEARTRVRMIVRVKDLPEAQMLRFAQEQEITFDELVDLDTGRTGDYPAAAPGENPLAGIGEAVLRSREMGFDAAAGSDGLQILQTDFALLEDADWERLAPDEVIGRLNRGRFAPRILNVGPRRVGRTRIGSRKDAEKEVVVFLCGFAPLRDIVFESYAGWDGEGFAQRR